MSDFEASAAAAAVAITGFREPKSSSNMSCANLPLSEIDVDSWRVEEKTGSDGKKYKNVYGQPPCGINLFPDSSTPLAFIPYGIEISSPFRDVSVESDKSLRLTIAVNDEQATFLRRLDEWAKSKGSGGRGKKSSQHYTSLLRVADDGYTTMQFKLVLQGPSPTQISFVDAADPEHVSTPLRGSGNQFLVDVLRMGNSRNARGWACKAKLAFSSLYESVTHCGINVVAKHLVLVRTSAAQESSGTNSDAGAAVDAQFEDVEAIVASMRRRSDSFTEA